MKLFSSPFARITGRAAGSALAFLSIGALLGGATLALAPWFVSSRTLVDALATQAQNATGLYLAAPGGARLALTPRPHIAVDTVGLADRNGALLIEVEHLYGVLKLPSLLAGRLEVGSIALIHPRATINLDDKTIDAPGAASRAAAAHPGTPQAQKADSARLALVSVVDGSLRLRHGGRDYAADRIEATLDWRKVGDMATLTGAFDWRGERLEGLLWVARPGQMLRGELSVATASFDGESLKLEAQGLAQLGANGRFNGRIAGSTPFVRQALRLLDIAAPLPGPFGDGQFSAQASLGANDARLKDLRLFVDGNEFTGSATLRRDKERFGLTAALRSDFVSLTPMLAETPTLLASDGQWSHEPFEPPDLANADVDLHVDAGHARLGRLSVDNAALDLTLRDGALDIALTHAQAYRGELKARAAFKPVQNGLSVRASAQTNRIDAGAMLWDAFGTQTLGGALDATMALEADGADMAALMQSLNGRATLGLSDGEIAGVDFDRALRHMEKRPLSGAQNIRSGHSPLAAARTVVTIEKGQATIADGSARGPGFTLAFSGGANIPERSLSIKAAAQEADADGARRDKGFQIAFDLAGGWDELSLTPDAQSIIRRSGAAAPLFPAAPTPPADKLESGR